MSRKSRQYFRIAVVIRSSGEPYLEFHTGTDRNAVGECRSLNDGISIGYPENEFCRVDEATAVLHAALEVLEVLDGWMREIEVYDLQAATLGISQKQQQ